MKPLDYKISIITPSFNKASFIASTIQSVLDQRFANWELIIVDDASTDDTKGILQAYASKEPRLLIALNSENKGGNHCRNQGIKMASGHFIMFLDADDVLTADCLENRLKYAQKTPDKDLWIFAMGAFYKKIGDAPQSHYWIPKEGNHLNGFLSHHIPWSVCQPLWSAEFTKQLNGFDLDFKRLQDVEMHTRAILNGARIQIIPNRNPDCFYRIDPERSSGNILTQLKTKTVSAIQYYQKFLPLVPNNLQGKLTGTLIESMGALTYNYRAGNIKLDEMNQLGKALIQTCRLKGHATILSFYFGLSKTLPFHPKGLKWFCHKLCKSS